MSSPRCGQIFVLLWTCLTSRFDAWGLSPGKIHTLSTVRPQTPATQMISFAGTEGPCSAGPESFKVKALHLVSVLIDHRHIISPVQGLICPLNQHLLSTAAVVCWGGGELEGLNHSRQVWLRANFLLPFVMSSGRLCVVRYAFPLNIEGFGGLALWEERTFSKINRK